MSNEAKSRALNMNFGTASNRLRKLILFDLLQRFDLDQCFQCGQEIEDVDDLSIEHKEPWQGADDPRAAFFNLDNIAFSHLRCNIGARQDAETANRQKTECLRGHPFDEKNTYWTKDGRRKCRQCNNRHNRRYRASLLE